MGHLPQIGCTVYKKKGGKKRNKERKKEKEREQLRLEDEQKREKNKNWDLTLTRGDFPLDFAFHKALTTMKKREKNARSVSDLQEAV